MLRLALLGISLLVASAVARADERPDERAVRVEVDGDPAAYFVDGYSLHVAVVGAWQRIDLGCYAVDEPGFLHGNEGWDVSLRAWTLGWEHFFSGDDGFFAGLSVAVAVRTYALAGTTLAVERHQLLVGPHVGWRFMLGAHFYLEPWLAVQYAYRGDAVTLDGRRFDDRPYVVFPTLYAGWRF
jgi:hypothetical protein